MKANDRITCTLPHGLMPQQVATGILIEPANTIDAWWVRLSPESAEIAGLSVVVVLSENIHKETP